MRIGTLFSGIGAPEQAAERVYGDNLKMVFACEYDDFARQSFLANYDINEDNFHKDIYEMDGTDYTGNVDILIGGSPCQAFSIAGLRKGLNDKRGELIYEYIRLVNEVKAPFIVYENVKGMLSIDNGKTIKEFVQALRDIGYHCHYSVLNSKDYGIPQNRERLFLVGFLDAELYHRFSFAPKIKLVKRLKDVLESDVNEKYKYNGNNKRVNNYISNNIFLNNTWIDVYSKLHRTDFASCITTRTSASCLTYVFVNGIIRKPTPIECLRLQDFPDTFRQVVSDSQMYKQAGNSMTVAVLEMIFNQIEKAKRKEITTLF